MLARHAEGTELTWRSLYACDNGWYELQPGCFEVLDLPSVNCFEDFNYGHPTHCILDGRDLGWTAAPSELLVVDAKEGVQVTPPSAPHALALQEQSSCLLCLKRLRQACT